MTRMLSHKDAGFSIDVKYEQIKGVPANPNCKKCPVTVKFSESGEPQRILVQTPRVAIPFGIKPDDTSVTVQIKDPCSDNPDVQQHYKFFVDLIETVSEKVKETALAHPKEVMNKPKEQFNEAHCEALFKAPLKRAAQEQYGMNMKLKFTTVGGADSETPVPDRLPSFGVYNSANERLDIPLKECFAKQNQMVAIIECNGLWSAGGQFGCSWKIVQMVTYKVQRELGFDFSVLPSEITTAADTEGSEPCAITTTGTF